LTSDSIKKTLTAYIITVLMRSQTGLFLKVLVHYDFIEVNTPNGV